MLAAIADTVQLAGIDSVAPTGLRRGLLIVGIEKRIDQLDNFASLLIAPLHHGP
jgi:hypothetical protein